MHEASYFEVIPIVSCNFLFVAQTAFSEHCNHWEVEEGEGDEFAGRLKGAHVALPVLVFEIHGDVVSWKACSPEADYLTHFFVTVNAQYYELKRYNRPAGGHTDRTIQMVEHAASRIKDLIQAHFAEDQTSAFKLPKAHAGYGPHVGDSIRLLGSPRRFMSEFGEGSVKTGHAAYEGTNKLHSTATEQMATILAFRNTATRHLSALGGAAAPAGLGSRRTARRNAAANFGNVLAKKPIASLPLSAWGDAQDVPVLRGRQGMDQFAKQFREYYEAAGEAVPWRIEIVNSAAVAGRQAHHAHSPVNTQVTQTIYATPNFRGEKRFSFVAIEGGDSEFMAQVQLLFRTPEDESEHAYVRYLTLDESRWDPALGNDQPDPLFGSGCTPLVWEKAGRGRWPFEVVLLSTIIRREFIFPDVRGVYAPPPS